MGSASFSGQWPRLIVGTLVLVAMSVLLSRLDWARLFALLQAANGLLLLVALPLGLVVIAAAGLRSRVLMSGSGVQHPTRRGDVLEYWRSLGVGMIGPGTLGADAYRVVVGGRRHGRYGAVAMVVVVEKVGALGACTLLAAAALPFAAPRGLQVGGWSIQVLLGVLMALSVLAILALPAVARHPRATWLADQARQHFLTWVQTLTHRGKAQAQHDTAAWPAVSKQDPLAADWEPVQRTPAAFAPSRPRGFGAHTLSLVLLWSVIAMSLSAMQSQLFFTALGVSIFPLVNLFVTPLLFIVLSLPLTPGGIGVRELSFVSFYGTFGVPVEAALTVSLLSMLSQLLWQGLGALLFFRSDRGR